MKLTMTEFERPYGCEPFPDELWEGHCPLCGSPIGVNLYEDPETGYDQPRWDSTWEVSDRPGQWVCEDCAVERVELSIRPTCKHAAVREVVCCPDRDMLAGTCGAHRICKRCGFDFGELDADSVAVLDLLVTVHPSRGRWGYTLSASGPDHGVTWEHVDDGEHASVFAALRAGVIDAYRRQPEEEGIDDVPVQE